MDVRGCGEDGGGRVMRMMPCLILTAPTRRRPEPTRKLGRGRRGTVTGLVRRCGGQRGRLILGVRDLHLKDAVLQFVKRESHGPISDADHSAAAAAAAVVNAHSAHTTSGRRRPVGNPKISNAQCPLPTIIYFIHTYTNRAPDLLLGHGARPVYYYRLQCIQTTLSYIYEYNILYRVTESPLYSRRGGPHDDDKLLSLLCIFFVPLPFFFIYFFLFYLRTYVLVRNILHCTGSHEEIGCRLFDNGRITQNSVKFVWACTYTQPSVCIILYYTILAVSLWTCHCHTNRTESIEKT